MRLFNQHQIRTQISLNGEWEYAFPTKGTAIAPGDWADARRVRIPVPGVWEMLPEFVNYRGQALARKTLSVGRAGPARLVFKAVSHTATVYLDGTEIGRHHNAYTPFSIDVPELTAGEHEIMLHISNEHGDISALHMPNDYYNYGGISRSAALQLLQQPIFIRHGHVVTEKRQGEWVASCRLTLRNLGAPTTAAVHAELAGATVAMDDMACPQGDSEVTFDLTPEDVTPWSPDNPRLYMLNAKLKTHWSDEFCDDWRDRIGFRTVSTDGERLLLNGESVFPVGFNRHEDHPVFGCAIPVEVMRQDLRLFKDLNCNAVRTCHYPNDELFLDLCDEMGFMVWEENHARGLSLENMQHPRFREQCAACNEEMVREHFNHPGIILWGLLNECSSETTEGAEMYREQIDQLRELDSSRPITFASNKWENDMCQGMVDVAGWNIYSRWYGEVEPRQDLDELVARMEPRGMENKPLIISEFGAGALPGYRDPLRRAKWSEERQADILEELLAIYAKHPRVAGLFIWQYCDVRVADEWARGRPRTMNNKGVVDEHRRPKLAYDIVKRAFGKYAPEVD